MTPEEYRALAERLAAFAAFLIEGGVYDRARCAALLREASAALLDANKALRQRLADEALRVRRSEHREFRRWIKMAGPEEDSMGSDEDALRMQGRWDAAEIMLECLAADEEDEPLAAALSVPAVPVDEEAL